MIFESEDVLHVYSFLKTYIIMVKNMKNYVTLDPDNLDDDDAEFRYVYRIDMTAHFEQDLYDKSFSLQDQSKGDQIDTLQNRIKFWCIIIVDTGGPTPDDIYSYDYNDDGPDHSVRGAEIFPEIREIKNQLDILRCKRFRNQLKFLKMKLIANHPKKLYCKQNR